MDAIRVQKTDKVWEVVGFHQGRDIAFRVTLPDTYSENEAMCVGNMAQRAISAFFGYRDHEQRIRDFVNQTIIGFSKKYAEQEKIIKLIQDYIGLAAATILGFFAYEKDMAAPQDNGLDFESPFGIKTYRDRKLDG